MLCMDAKRMGRTQDHHMPSDRMGFAGTLNDSFVVVVGREEIEEEE